MLQDYISNLANQFGINPEIHPNDTILTYLRNHPSMQNDSDIASYYINDGKLSADKAIALIKKFYPSTQKLSFLEFACGHGCVTRHLIKSTAITMSCCDILSDAVNFIQDKLHISSFLSSTVPEQLICNKNFDIVFALSFFSHMPFVTWERWLHKLFSLLSSNGLLIFTTHGRISAKKFRIDTLPENGFLFTKYASSSSLSIDEYGDTFVLPSFVFRLLNNLLQSDIVMFEEGYWWNHQDIYILRKR